MSSSEDHPMTPATPQLDELLRLDNNEGSWVTEEQAHHLSRSAPETLRNYPSAISLELAIAERLTVEPEQVMVTAGADGAIDRCFRVLLPPESELILTAPTFQQFHRFAATTPATVREVPWKRDFPCDEILTAMSPRTSMVAYATPNNPTGQTASARDLERISESLRDGWVMLDHAYVEYAEEDLTKFALSLPNVVVIRTFSKAWGMAGCRMGYLLGPEALVRSVRAVGNPYPVSGVSVAIMTQRYRDGTEDVNNHLTRITKEREKLCGFFESYEIPVPDSHANFLFPRFGDRTSFVRNALEMNGIIVRAFPDRAELRDGLRISLPDDQTALNMLMDALTLALDPEAILFDMDGVLANTNPSYGRCIRETVSHFGVEVTDNHVEGVMCDGQSSNDWVVVQRILANHDVVVPLNEIEEHFQRLYLGTADSDGYHLLETATVDADWFESLSAARPVGVVTGRPRVEAEAFLRRFELESFVETMVCMEDAPGKPDPAPVRKAADDLGVTRLWMIGDSPDDVNAAKGAGVLPIGIAPPSGPRHDALARAGAVAILPDVSSLKRLLP